MHKYIILFGSILISLGIVLFIITMKQKLIETPNFENDLDYHMGISTEKYIWYSENFILSIIGAVSFIIGIIISIGGFFIWED